MLKKLSSLLIVVTLLLACHQAPKSTPVKQLAETTANLKTQMDLPIVFPSYLPPAKTKVDYYAYGEAIPNGYTIYVDSSADCHGVHYCNLGYVQAIAGATIVLQNDRDGKPISQTITDNGKTLYFTAGHAMGDYFPAQLQWQTGNVLYSISWQADQATLLQIYHSMQ